MNNQASGALIATEPIEVHVPETINALAGQVSNLVAAYRRVLAPDFVIKTEADKWYFRAILKKLSAKVCGFKKNPHLCSVHHLIQARRLAKIVAAGIFYVFGLTYSSVPCGALMRPQPESGGEQRGAELFLFPPCNSQHIVSF